MKLFEETVDRKIVYQGKIVTLRTDIARLENGRMTGREVVEHPGGVCILPLEADGTTYTVRQFRYHFGEVIEELPSGKLDDPEDLETGARRALGEEIGWVAGEII